MGESVCRSASSPGFRAIQVSMQRNCIHVQVHRMEQKITVLCFNDSTGWEWPEPSLSLSMNNGRKHYLSCHKVFITWLWQAPRPKSVADFLISFWYRNRWENMHHISVHHFGPVCNISATVRWISLKFYTDVQGTKRLNFNDFGDSLTFYVVPPAGQTSLTLTKGMVQSTIQYNFDWTFNDQTFYLLNISMLALSLWAR